MDLGNFGTKSKSWQYLKSFESWFWPKSLKCQDLYVLQNWESYVVRAFYWITVWFKSKVKPFLWETEINERKMYSDYITIHIITNCFVWLSKMFRKLTISLLTTLQNVVFQTPKYFNTILIMCVHRWTQRM